MHIERELEEMQSCLERCQTLRTQPGAGKARAPEVSLWSVEQHLYHSALACDLSFRNVLSLLAGEGMLVVKGGQSSEDADQLLGQRVFPRGKAQAPRMVRPGDEVNERFLAQEQANNQAILADLRASSEAIEAAPDHIPHQVLGLMSAAQWLCFANLHTRHHLAIVDDILAATVSAP